MDSKDNPVNVELGSLIYDGASQSQRDVDITFSTMGDDGTSRLLTGFEVKKHRRPLDVIHVEQLAAKMADMPDIGFLGIVSASGYTGPALKKCIHHKITALNLKKWNPSAHAFTNIDIRQLRNIEISQLDWVGSPHVLFDTEANISLDAKLFDQHGSSYHLRTLMDVANSISQQVPQMFESQTPGFFEDLLPHDIEQKVRISDPPYVDLNGELKPLEWLVVAGTAVKRHHKVKSEYRLLVNEVTGEPYSECMLAESSTGLLVGVSVGTLKDELGVFLVQPQVRLKTIRKYPLHRAPEQSFT